jgi:hypothetical protein
MNGLLRRLKRRAATADENPPGTPAASEPVDATATQITVEGGSGLSEEEQERIRRRRDVPAGLDAAELEATQGEGARRGSVRRRVRYLRRARELLLRDLGGFEYEVHRAAGGRQNVKHREILDRKAERLAALDRELRELERRLGEPHRAETVVREPGIGGICPECGELHGSDAGWCAHCGTPLTDRARKRHEQEVDRTIAAREAAAAEQAREAERAREAAAAGAAAAAEPANDATKPGDAPTSELPADAAGGATGRGEDAGSRDVTGRAERAKSGGSAENAGSGGTTGDAGPAEEDPVPAERRS